MISESCTERLLRGPAYGLRKWPGMMALIADGLAKVDTRTFYPNPGTTEPMFKYELTDKGRRKAAFYRFQAAGHGK